MFLAEADGGLVNFFFSRLYETRLFFNTSQHKHRSIHGQNNWDTRSDRKKDTFNFFPLHLSVFMCLVCVSPWLREFRETVSALFLLSAIFFACTIHQYELWMSSKSDYLIDSIIESWSVDWKSDGTFLTATKKCFSSCDPFQTINIFFLVCAKTIDIAILTQAKKNRR